eukprot:6778013-Pyramimonas_sp.AAC.1
MRRRPIDKSGVLGQLRLWNTSVKVTSLPGHLSFCWFRATSGNSRELAYRPRAIKWFNEIHLLQPLLENSGIAPPDARRMLTACPDLMSHNQGSCSVACLPTASCIPFEYQSIAYHATVGSNSWGRFACEPNLVSRVWIDKEHDPSGVADRSSHWMHECANG